MHNVSALTIWKQDQKKKKALRQLGYKVEVIHECDIRRELAESKEMREFFETCSIPVQKRKTYQLFPRSHWMFPMHSSEGGRRALFSTRKWVKTKQVAMSISALCKFKFET